MADGSRWRLESGNLSDPLQFFFAVALYLCHTYLTVVVSPDAGGVYRAKKFREGLAHRYGLDAGLAMIIKQRAVANEVRCAMQQPRNVCVRCFLK